MKCPKCGKEMKVKKEDVSYNSQVEPNKEYSRKVFWCKNDDIWITEETPQSV